MNGRALTLGDAGASNDDASYGGALPDPATLSLDWFRKQYSDFQSAMTRADEAYQAGSAAFILTGDEGIAYLLADYDSKASQIKALALTLNQGAEVVNAIGGRVPVLSIPRTLGALPLAIPAAVLAAAAAVSYWFTWSRGFASGMAEGIAAARAAAVQAGATPDVVAAIDAEAAKAQQAASSIFGNPLGSLAGVVKLGVIGGLAYLAWRSFNDVFDR